MQLEFLYKETWLHRVNPSLKFLVIVFLFIHVLFIHNINVVINYMAVALVLYALCTGHPPKRLLLIFLPFLLIFLTSSTSMVFFGQGETTWWKWGFVHITEESFLRGMHLGFRGIIFAAFGVVFSLTTRPVYLFYSLMQQMKLKPEYAYSFMAAVRMVPMMVEEFQTLRYALKVRGVQDQKGVTGFFKKFKAYSIPMLSQSIRRAHRIAVAMEAKRFSRTTGRTFFYKIGFSKFDLLFILYFLAAIPAAYVLAVYFPYFSVFDVRFIQ